MCERRNFSKVDTKLQKEIIWIIWDLFLHEAEIRGKFVKKVIDALFSLFTLKYVTGCQKKRKNILYFAVSILCENINSNEEIMRPSQQELVSNILKKISLIYGQIKKNEEATGTEYFDSPKELNKSQSMTSLPKSTLNSTTADSDLKKIWHTVLRECHRNDKERSGAIDKKLFIELLRKANDTLPTEKKMKMSKIINIADKYSKLSKSEVDYLSCFRKFLNDYTPVFQAHGISKEELEKYELNIKGRFNRKMF
jgi:hypothetical protein